MSVLKSKRGECDFRVLNDARELAEHTIHKVKSEQLFPKRNRWIITQKIANEVIEALSCIRRANSARLDPDDPEACSYRHSQQVEAMAHLNALYGILDIAFCTLNELRNDDSYDHWVGLIDKTETGLRNWMASDKKKLRGTA